MPDTASIIRARDRQRQREKRSPAGVFGLGCALLLSLFVAATGVLLSAVYASLSHDLPSLQSLPALMDPEQGSLLQPTRLYDRTGEQILLTLENPATGGRQMLTLDSSEPNYLPPPLITSTLASADPGFWQHNGFSSDGILQGTHPTLAQQLASDLLLWDEPAGLRRSLRERLLAYQITARFGRPQVLAWYLNTQNYGRLAFGADAASRVYFGKKAAELTLAEAAVLAAVARSPALNPLDAPQAALDIQQELLRAMLEQGWITPQMYERASQERLSFQPADVSGEDIAPALAGLVLEQLSPQVDLMRLERGGLRVITTLDYNLQLQAACAAETQLARLAKEELPARITAADGQECLSARLLPTLPQKEGQAPKGLGANVIIYDPENGEVLAMVGQTSSGLDPAHQPGHPPGTLVTPFIYLTAFTRGIGPASLLWDIPPEGAANPDFQYHGPVRLRTALANDYIIPLDQLIAQVGAQNILETASQFGLDFETQDVSADALLNDQEMTLLALSQAYGVLANGGILAGGRVPATETAGPTPSIQPVTILRVEDDLGRPWPEENPVAGANLKVRRPLVNPDLAYLATHVLSDEPARWSSLGHPNPLEIGRPAAAKIGRTSNQQDAWTIGYIPQLLVGVWIGDPELASTSQVSADHAAALWHAVIQYAAKDLPAEEWPVPQGVSQVQVCNPSGLLPSTDCPDVVNEIFLSGTEPTQVDNLYRSIQINRETGRLATVFTSPDLVEERVYMILPPEAEEWARLSGLPTPPDEYDVITAYPGESSTAAITAPGMFAFVRGIVNVAGSALGEGFAYYRLLFGSGLNPQEWLQIGEDTPSPVNSGFLGAWDTTGLDGIYALQLQVVQLDQRVGSAIVQVTVDNQPPKAAVANPISGQEVSPRAGQITLLAEASDNLGIQSVAFYLDGKLVGERFQSPFAIPWKSQPGAHILRVVALDQAGNSAEAEAEFISR